LVFTLDTAVL